MPLMARHGGRLEPDVVVDPLGRADGNDPFIAAAIAELERGRPTTR